MGKQILDDSLRLGLSLIQQNSILRRRYSSSDYDVFQGIARFLDNNQTDVFDAVRKGYINIRGFELFMQDNGYARQHPMYTLGVPVAIYMRPFNNRPQGFIPSVTESCIKELTEHGLYNPDKQCLTRLGQQVYNNWQQTHFAIRMKD